MGVCVCVCVCHLGHGGPAAAGDATIVHTAGNMQVRAPLKSEFKHTKAS